MPSIFVCVPHFCENVLVIFSDLHSEAQSRDNQSPSWPLEITGFSRLIAAVYMQPESQELIIFLLFGLKFEKFQTKTSSTIQVNHEDKCLVAESTQCIPIKTASARHFKSNILHIHLVNSSNLILLLLSLKICCCS